MRVHQVKKTIVQDAHTASILEQIEANKAKGRTPAEIAADGMAIFNAAPANLPPKIGLTLVAGKATQETKKANDKANYDAGAGAAEAFLNVVKSQAVSLKVYLQRIAETDQQWRKGFRVTLDKARDDMRAHVNARKGMPDFEVYEQAFKSTQPRISEAITFSKAIDNGFTPDMAQGYHAIIGASRAFLNSSSASSEGEPGTESIGPTVRKQRGRKATPVLDKVKNYLLGLSLTVEQLEDVSRMVDTMVKLAKVQQAAMH
jgi:hypothetical protein